MVSHLIFSFSIASASERPDLEIQVGSIFICEIGKSLSGPIYSNYCSQESSTSRVAYISFVPSEIVLFMSEVFYKGKLGTVQYWCEWEINDGRVAPSCIFRVRKAYDNSAKFLDLPVKKAVDNLFLLDLSPLEKGFEYHAQLIEMGSGSMASSQLIPLK